LPSICAHQRRLKAGIILDDVVFCRLNYHRMQRGGPDSNRHLDSPRPCLLDLAFDGECSSLERELQFAFAPGCLCQLGYAHTRVGGGTRTLTVTGHWFRLTLSLNLCSLPHRWGVLEVTRQANR